MYEELAIIAAFTFCYSVISGRVDRMSMSAPIVFVFVGLLLGPSFLSWLPADVAQIEYRTLIDLTLALVLFNDAASSDSAVLRVKVALPARLLLLGLPGAIGLGFIIGYFVFGDLAVYEVAILATMLAATDAALGKAVVSNEAVPARLREGLNCESGLNDGMAVPVLLVFIALAHSANGVDSEVSALELVAEEIGIGAGVGLVVAGIGAWLLREGAAKGWVSKVWVQLSVPALAITCFALAQSLHGSGYIAAFVGGMLFGILAKEATHKLVMPSEGIGEAMAMLTWMIFGAVVIARIATEINLEIALYAVLSLTVIRMLPIFLSLTGSGESNSSKLFLGWFGPRGLASIVFAIIVVNEQLPGSDFMATVVATTVLLSLVAHGVSANPLARWIAGREGKAGS
ncbi:MAG: cation:proton antiporter [Woeseiaceae bacterium]